MGVPWREHPAWEVVDLVADATGRDLESLLIDADADTLKATRNAQLAAFGLSLVILEAARTEGGLDDTQVRAVAGHSLGEYTALVAAGALTAEAGARLVDARGEAMQVATDAEPGTMAAMLGLDTPLVVEACQAVEGAWPANDNAPGQVVIAGTAEGVAAAGEAARERGAKRVVPLPVGGAFHSPLMMPAQDRLDAALAAAVFGTGQLSTSSPTWMRQPTATAGWPCCRPSWSHRCAGESPCSPWLRWASPTSWSWARGRNCPAW